MTDESRFFLKNWGLIFCPTGQKQGQKEVFCYFLEFGWLDFLEITYNDSLQQFLSSSRGKTDKKIWSPNFGPKSGQKLGVFLLFTQAWFISYLLNCIGDSLEQFLDTSRGKLHTKNWDVQIWAKWAKIGPKIRFFTIFWSFVSVIGNCIGWLPGRMSNY